ncbi:glycosyltransferase [Actinomadura sp. HBU206391]|uniref:glycosyltransferase n=1 Tax=Actinomadura sp. HBU206391 TaxID=2731692 RepID=UPI001650B6D8|nr:glycosyltransferase [Actinomadura sp. HBU206391]MBC6458761.1 glycosyltransferase [Actinomadura sp. HBU206391]
MSEQRDIFLVCDAIGGPDDGRRDLHRLGELLASSGHRVRLIAVRAGGDRPEPAFETTVLTARLRFRGGGRVISRLGEIFRSARPGGVVIVTHPAAMEWVGRADTAGLKVVGVHRVPHAVAETKPGYAQVLRDFARADRFLALTREDADGWARAGLSNADVIPDWFDTGAPEQAEPAPATGQVVLGPSVLTHDKGVDMLLESWAVVARRQPSWRLRFHGTGPEEPRLRRMAAELGVDDSVEFHPAAQDPETTLSEASIVALPSREEVFPEALLAAMGHGLPVVAFDCSPAVREVLTGEVDGLLVDPGHTEQFALALELLMTDEGLRDKLGRGARESVRRFSSENISARWNRLFTLLFR